MPSGMTVANIRVATSESWKDKQSGEQKERTRVASRRLVGRLGEIAASTAQGLQVYIEDRSVPQVAGQGSRDRYTTEVIASDMQMIGGRGGAGGGTGGTPAATEARERAPVP